MFKFGNKSTERLKTCHVDLQQIMQLAISRSSIDFAITEGHRSIERQQELYKQGKSRIDGVHQKGKHNYFPSMAVDLAIYHPDLSTRKKILYDTNSLSYVAGIIESCAKELYEKGTIKHLIRWGGNWDKDGVIVHDQKFDDLPHFELVANG